MGVYMEYWLQRAWEESMEENREMIEKAIAKRIIQEGDLE